MINFNQHQILSIDLSMANRDMKIITASTINSSFTHLESLSLDNIESDILLSLLSHLASLPRLFSLFIDQWSEFQALSDCYVLIFNLPKLKYLKCLVNESRNANITVLLPMPASQRVSTTSQDLSTIITYTPHFMH
jgi:Ulp1 family protease